MWNTLKFVNLIVICMYVYIPGKFRDLRSWVMDIDTVLLGVELAFGTCTDTNLFLDRLISPVRTAVDNALINGG